MQASETSPPTLRVAPMTLLEVIRVAGELQALVGAQLQECLQSSTELGLGFYHDRKIRWLWIDLDPRRPIIIKLDQPPPVKKLARPLSLFIRSHFQGRRLKSVSARVSEGRVLVFEFHRASDEDETGEISVEVRLLPHGQNVTAKFGKKQISELKPKELSASQVEIREDENSRTLEQLTNEWLELKKNRPAAGSPKKAADPEKDWHRAIEKKEGALIRMREELAEKSSQRERELGEWLKEHGTLEVPTEFSELVDLEKSLSWNIESAFKRAKDKERKIDGTRTRIAFVEGELAKLKADGPRAQTSQQAQSGKSLLSKAEAKGRRFKLSDDVDVYVGKSAADNLALLRKAQPFDYWLHLRDQPGSHAILRRTRGRLITDQEFTMAAKWVIEESLKKNANELRGERHDVLIVECRFVRPIKGDKLGRVNYSNDRVLSVRF
jgi:predicted ribosome quality control (RQC) complex YloA/Tae2 family protein